MNLYIARLHEEKNKPGVDTSTRTGDNEPAYKVKKVEPGYDKEPMDYEEESECSGDDRVTVSFSVEDFFGADINISKRTLEEEDVGYLCGLLNCTIRLTDDKMVEVLAKNPDVLSARAAANQIKGYFFKDIEAVGVSSPTTTGTEPKSVTRSSETESSASDTTSASEPGSETGSRLFSVLSKVEKHASAIGFLKKIVDDVKEKVGLSSPTTLDTPSKSGPEIQSDISETESKPEDGSETASDVISVLSKVEKKVLETTLMFERREIEAQMADLGCRLELHPDQETITIVGASHCVAEAARKLQCSCMSLDTRLMQTEETAIVDGYPEYSLCVKVNPMILKNIMKTNHHGLEEIVLRVDGRVRASDDFTELTFLCNHSREVLRVCVDEFTDMYRTTLANSSFEIIPVTTDIPRHAIYSDILLRKLEDRRGSVELDWNQQDNEILLFGEKRAVQQASAILQKFVEDLEEGKKGTEGDQHSSTESEGDDDTVVHWGPYKEVLVVNPLTIDYLRKSEIDWAYVRQIVPTAHCIFQISDDMTKVKFFSRQSREVLRQYVNEFEAICQSIESRSLCAKVRVTNQVTLPDHRLLDVLEDQQGCVVASFNNRDTEIVLFGDKGAVQSAATDLKQLVANLIILERQGANSGLFSTTLMRPDLRKSARVGKFTVEIVEGDITGQNVDVIVNDANHQLAHGGGVALAIVRAGGDCIQRESTALLHRRGWLNVSEVVDTHAGRLPCRRVIHAVGPVWPHRSTESQRERCMEQLRLTCRNCLEKASKLSAKSIAFPIQGLSSFFGMPKDLKAQCLLDEIYQFCNSSKSTSLELIRFVLCDQTTVDAFAGYFDELFLSTSSEDCSDSVHDMETETFDRESCSFCKSDTVDLLIVDCGHTLCSQCANMPRWRGVRRCRKCLRPFGKPKGMQPQGCKMTISTNLTSLPGYRDCGTIVITYYIPSGIQTEEHPHPGQRYPAASHTAYLPDNDEGNDVLRLLQRAFDLRLVFTIDRASPRTKALEDTVVWNGIPHKTSRRGGPER